MSGQTSACMPEYGWPADDLESVDACPACGHPARVLEHAALEDLAFSTAPGLWDLQRCITCRSVFLDPRPTPASIHRAYSSYYTHFDAAGGMTRGAKAWLQRAIGNAYRNHLFGTTLKPSLPLGRWLAPLFRASSARIRAQGRGLEKLTAKRGNVLDIGCGNGAFLALTKQMGWNPYGVEFDDTAAKLAEKLGVIIPARQLQELDKSYNGFFDAVTLSHVIEHLHDPLRTFEDCLRVMKPGGYIWVETPNIESVGHATYGRHWRGLEPPRHLVLFNPESLRALMEKAGFQDVRVIPSLDVSRVIFTVSTLLRQGFPATSGVNNLSPAQRRKLDDEIAHAQSVAKHNANKTEFTCVAACRPVRGTGQ